MRARPSRRAAGAGATPGSDRGGPMDKTDIWPVIHTERKALAADKTPIILPLDFPKPPEIERPEQAVEYDLDELQHWDRAPSNPARLAVEVVVSRRFRRASL